MRRKDLTNMQFGKLTVQKMIYGEVKGGKKRTQCECICECGTHTIVVIDALTSGRKVSCGCDTAERRSQSNRIDLVGRRFGSLVATEMLWDHHPTKVKCICDCGVVVTVNNSDLTSGHTMSCGCLQRSAASLSNTKDWTGITSSYGVEFIRQDCKNKAGQWLWVCKCGLCGSIFSALPAKVMNGHITSCGCRKQSAREEFIQSVLRNNNIDFISQYCIDECKYSQPLPFDFAIFRDGKLKLLVEYDGRQHFSPIPHFGGQPEFEKRQARDAIKDLYCKSNNIPLLRLPYTLTDKEIETQLLDAV